MGIRLNDEEDDLRILILGSCGRVKPHSLPQHLSQVGGKVLGKYTMSLLFDDGRCILGISENASNCYSETSSSLVNLNHTSPHSLLSHLIRFYDMIWL